MICITEIDARVMSNRKVCAIADRHPYNEKSMKKQGKERRSVDRLVDRSVITIYFASYLGRVSLSSH
jgi:hypothetical protein